MSPNRLNNRPVQQRQSQNSNQNSNFGRGQGFQGQAISGSSDVQQIMEQMQPSEPPVENSRPVLLNNVPFELQQINRSPINQAAETIDLNEFKEIIEGLGENKQPRRPQLSAENSLSQQAIGSSPPNVTSGTLMSDPFGDQLEKEMSKKNDSAGQQRAINFSPMD